MLHQKTYPKTKLTPISVDPVLFQVYSMTWTVKENGLRRADGVTRSTSQERLKDYAIQRKLQNPENDHTPITPEKVKLNVALECHDKVAVF